MFVALFSCTIFSLWPSKGLKCRKSENQKSTKVIFFFGARHHVIWSFWSQIDQLITMWTPTHQFQKLPFLPDYHPPLLVVRSCHFDVTACAEARRLDNTFSLYNPHQHHQHYADHIILAYRRSRPSCHFLGNTPGGGKLYLIILFHAL